VSETAELPLPRVEELRVRALVRELFEQILLAGLPQRLRSSAFRSKWFSIDALPGPVTNSSRSMPTRVSSSTTYCTTGLRPTGSISLGWDFVAGSRRVPRPATGTTAMLMDIGFERAKG
jgi:hypothetical protein